MRGAESIVGGRFRGGGVIVPKNPRGGFWAQSGFSLPRPVLHDEVGAARAPVGVEDAEVAGAGVPGQEGGEVEVPEEHHSHRGVVFLAALDGADDVLARLLGGGVLALPIAVRAVVAAPAELCYPHLLLGVAV